MFELATTIRFAMNADKKEWSKYVSNFKRRYIKAKKSKPIDESKRLEAISMLLGGKY